MNYAKLSPSLFLSEKPVNSVAKTKALPEPTNHIWEIDRSGSMGSLLPSLVRDLKAKARELRAGDTLSLGWFSGEGQNNFVLKGFRIAGEADLKVLDTAFDNLARTVGLTCFSEILESTEQVCRDVSIFGTRYAFMLFTDGYPVVSNYSREVERIGAAVDKLKATLTSSLIVGYGDYYNKELLVDVARRIGGALIHSSALPHFGLALQAWVRDQQGIGNRVAVSCREFGADTQFFTIQGENVVVLTPRKDGFIDVPTTAGGEDTLYALTKTKPVDGVEVKFSGPGLHKGSGKQELLGRGAYAAAVLLTQTLQADQAIDVLSKVGDVALIDAVNNAFTNAEYGAAEDQLKAAMVKPHARQTQGFNATYAPRPDAYCLLDLLEDLRDSEFFPGHPDFEYKKTGPASKTKDGFGKFTYRPGAGVKMGSFVWNQTRLNLSLQAQIPGFVELQPKADKEAQDFGLADHYPAFVFRAFTLVKDGVLNVTKLPVTLPSQAIFNKLLKLGALDSGGYTPFTWDAKTVFPVDLTKIPVMNRAMANGRTSATALAKLVWRELELQGQLKALKFYANDLEKTEDKKTTLGKGEIFDFLVANGIDPDKGFLYSPETEKEETTDFYMAKSFAIAVKGCSSLPKVTDVEDKLENIAKAATDPKVKVKALTKSETLVQTGVESYRKSGMGKQSQGVALTWLQERVAELQTELRGVRTEIQKTKFAVILGKKWFDELKSRDNPSLTVGDNEFTFKLGEEKVSF